MSGSNKTRQNHFLCGDVCKSLLWFSVGKREEEGAEKEKEENLEKMLSTIIHS